MDAMRSRLVEGLTSSPKYIPSWYTYDEMGSVLHDQCTTENKGYYLFRGQIEVLQKHTKKMIENAPYDLSLADVACGSCSKTKYFLDELLKNQSHVNFFALDISKDFLMGIVHNLSEEYGEKLTCKPIGKDYNNGLDELRQDTNPKIILWLGSIINLTYEDQVAKLKKIAALLTDRCYLIFSIDITQDEDVILNSYDDNTGHHMRFYQNNFKRLNREERSNFNLSKFSFKTDFVRNTAPDNTSYTVAYMQAKETMDVHIPGLNISLHFQKDECIYFADGPGSGTSCKYTKEQVCTLTKKAGLQLTNTWTDEEEHVMFCKCKVK